MAENTVLAGSSIYNMQQQQRMIQQLLLPVHQSRTYRVRDGKHLTSASQNEQSGI